MRYLISLAIIIGIIAWFKYGNTDQTIDYAVKAKDNMAMAQVYGHDMKYHVFYATRLLGADIFRGRGMFTEKTEPSGTSIFDSLMIKPKAKITVANIFGEDRSVVPADTVSQLALQPDFGLWEEYGKWILLMVALTALIFIIRAN